MKKIIYVFITLFLFFSSIASSVYAQTHTSKDNYKGDWTIPGTWKGESSPGLSYSIKDGEVLVLGEIKSSENLYFSKGLLTVRDTLVIDGSLGFGNEGDLAVESTGVLIVLGHLNVGNKVDIAAGGTIIVRDSVNFSGAAKWGSFTSTDTPSQVYIGGYTGTPPTSTIGGTAVFNCATDSVHTNSTCNYGFIVDIEEEDIEDYYKEVICGGGVDAGSISVDPNPICSGAIVPKITGDDQGVVDYEWFYSTDSGIDLSLWTALGVNAKDYSPVSIDQTTYFYRQVKKGGGCVANTDYVEITVLPTPDPQGVYHD